MLAKARSLLTPNGLLIKTPNYGASALPSRRLCAAFTCCFAPCAAFCQSNRRHDSSQAAQVRRSRAHERPTHQSSRCLQVVPQPKLGARCHPSPRGRKRSRLAQLTRDAATRNQCGSITRPTETKFFASLEAMGFCAPHIANKPPRKSARSCEHSVRNPR